jgi:tetratricopeptide (TPR) repeat protein
MSGGFYVRLAAATALVVAVAGGTSPAADPAGFAQRRSAIIKTIETQPEAAVVALVEEGVAAGQPQQALAAAQQWLRVNLPQNSLLLYHAGRAAERSGDWSSAVALYQQFLERADPKSAEASDAITAVYTLTIGNLDDAAAAYAFGRSMAPKLAVNPRFRQFDRWFLDTAMSRGDRAAVAARLLAIVNAGASRDELLALHEGDFRWLVRSLRGARYDIPADRVTPEFTADCKAIAAAAPLDDEMRLLLAWAPAVRLYIAAKIAGQEASPPLAEAKALLEKFPRYAQMVQTDFAGGHNGQHYRDDPKKYWPHEVEAKMALVRAALPKLTPVEQANLLDTWNGGYYAGGPQVLAGQAAREFVLANPTLINSITGTNLWLGWESLDSEAASKLAPLLERNPFPEASLVRAVAAAGKEKNLDKAIDALLGPEAWRLGPQELGGYAADRLWHWAGRPGGNAVRDQHIKRSQAIAAEIQKAALKPQSPAGERIAAFKQLLADLRSPKPKIPGVRGRVIQALSVTPEVLPELLKDGSIEARRFVAAALASDFDGEKAPLSGDQHVRGLSTTTYDPLLSRLLARTGQNIDYLKKNNLYRAHPLEPVLRKAVADQVASSGIDPGIVIAWINARGPADTMLPADVDGERKLIEALLRSPAWKSFPIEARFAVRSAFPQMALAPAELAIRKAADPWAICADFLALPKSADAAATAAALRTAIEGLRRSPVRCEMVGLEKLAELSPDVIKAPEVIAELATLADSLRSLAAPPVIGQRLMPMLTASRDEVTLERMAAWLWRCIATGASNAEPLVSLTDSLVSEKPSAASTLAVCGLGAIARYKQGHRWFRPEIDVPRLQAIRGKAAMKLGLVVIPVGPDHPAYPIYQSQAEWLTGNEDTAGELLDSNWDAFLSTHRQLSAPYLMWALRRSINSRDAERQESIIRPLLSWAAEPANPFTPDERVRLEIAYGDIAVQRGQLPEAFAIFGRVRANPELKDLTSRHEATLRQVSVARATKDFETAIAILEELDGERIPELWAPVRHARAEVFFDMEEYDDTADVIEAILARSPDDADAKILLAKVQVARQQLIDATEVEVGSASGQKTLVPGERLKVTLSDPTLAVSGTGTEIEVTVQATSGDREDFLLRRFGDQKEKFRGEVQTALGAAAPGDGVLQVIGDDEIFYSYSDRFRQKLPGLPDTRGGPITVTSDALLMASARKLPTEAEQRMADVRAVMEKIGVSEGRAIRMLAAGGKDPVLNADRAIDITKVVKPGNPVHVRVIDPDKSRTAGIDEAIVSVATSSGDSVSRVVLRETGPFTGWFEGDVPTAGAQASAFAPNSAPGRDPNAVISPGSYPSWKPVPVKGATPSVTIDLNDNIPLGEMTIKASEQGARLTKFLVKTAITSGDWTTVAAQPKDFLAVADPSRPSVTVLNDTDALHNQHHPQHRRKVHDLREMVPHADGGWLTQQFAQGTAMNVTGPSHAFPASIPKAVDWKRQGQHAVSHVIYRFRGWFHEPVRVSRRFKLDLGAFAIPPGTHPSLSDPAEYLLVVDGKAITKPGGPLEGEVSLAPGVHRFEIWSTGWVTSIGFGRSSSLKANLDADSPTAMVACPDTFFDPASFPPGVMPLRNPPATLTASPDGTEFQVKFAEGSRGRFIRLDLVGHEGPVPSLDKITLVKPDGSRVLPVAEDFATLRKNTTLEILPGDTLAIRHVDDRFVTKAKETQERSLNVAFTDARVEFADMEPRFDSRSGEMEPYYEPLIRFQHDEPLSLAIHDADMDASVEPDTVAVTLASKAGGKREFKAVETGDSTGVFKLVVTPVAGAPDGDNEFQVDVGGRLAALYKDRENNSPGVPIERTGTILHAAFTEPRMLLAHARVTPIAEKAAPQAAITPKPVNRPRWLVTNTLIPTDKPPEGGFHAVTGLNLFAELVAPNLLLRPTSEVTIYAQTDSGRQLAGARAASEPAGFDLSVPGTIALTCGIVPSVIDPRVSQRDTRIPLLDIYTGGTIWSAYPIQRNDRFFLTVPLVAGVIPDHGVLTAEEKKEREAEAALLLDSSIMPEIEGALVVRPGDRVHLAMTYTDASGKEQWLTASTAVITHPAFDLVSDDGTETQAAFVGESLLPRVVDFGADVSDEPDTVGVLFQAKSGAKTQVVLHETAPHSGVFQAACTLTYASAQGQAPPDEFGGPSAPSQPLPVIYGDMVAARYTDRAGTSTDTMFVSVSKGADGTIAPFSKTYGDEEIAARTQFSLAEAYLEMAKRHRSLGQIETADQEYAAAKQMLLSVMNAFPDPETRAHAEFLLGNLTLEEAKAAPDAAARETLLRSALARFMSVTGSYPDTLHASKAQFATAMVYEALGEPEIAAQDYVKLAYKYPDSEYLAKAMARLGTFFLMRASAIEKKAAPFLERAETDPEAKFQSEKLRAEAIIEYLKTAKIFGRLHERFPSHELAGPAGLQSGEAYMRAGQTQRALDTFLKVSRDQAYDGPKIRARAMYWAGTCYQKLRQPMAAFSIYKRLTYDFPESEWAKNAIGQLSQPDLADLESKLELERLEAQQE